MSLESAIEDKIREAIERGDFDDLEGKGKPLDLDPYFATPEDRRLAYSILKSNQFVPAEVEIMKEISRLKQQADESTDEKQRRILSSKLNERRLALRVLLDRRR
jgi:DnaJ homologue, subfamily C, member 28, conserved domain